MTPLLTPVRPARPAPPAVGWLGWLGVAVAAGVAFVSAAWEVFLAPLTVQWTSHGHAHWFRLPVALAGAIVVNAALTWFVRAVTGRIVLVMGAFVAWIAVILVASARTREGDLVLTGNNWVGVAVMFAGSTAFVVTAIALSLAEVRRATAGGHGEPGLARSPGTG